jgi:hypothetical protein
MNFQHRWGSAGPVPGTGGKPGLSCRLVRDETDVMDRGKEGLGAPSAVWVRSRDGAGG